MYTVKTTEKGKPLNEDEAIEKKQKKEEETYLLSAHGLAESEEKQKKHQPTYHYIAPELQRPIPEGKELTEISSSLTPEELADTYDGKTLLADRMTRMKKASPPGTEIGVRINPKTGNAEIYARGEKLNGRKFRKNMGILSQVPITMFKSFPLYTNAYENPISHLSPEEQNTLIKNSREVTEMVEGVPLGLNSRKEIQNYFAARALARGLQIIGLAVQSPDETIGYAPPKISKPMLLSP